MVGRHLLAVLFLVITLPLSLAAQRTKSIVVVTAGSGDYLFGCGGTLANFIDEGFKVYVVQIGNDEKDSVGLGPAETRLVNTEDAEKAARILGVSDILNVNDKSGELGVISTNEMRNHISVMIRHWKPEKLFLPDPYMHYEPDWDQYFTGKGAEETNYSNGGYFLPEATKAGLRGHGPRETYYYGTYRPYRPGEGGHNSAKFMPVDITKNFNKKVAAIQVLRNRNHRYAFHTKARLEMAGKPVNLLSEINEATTRGLIRAYVKELAEAIGEKNGFQYGEEFNYHGRAVGEEAPLAPWIEERAKPIPE
jgi:LmbE family N-acetylglucosaminyl deacetylase